MVTSSTKDRFSARYSERLQYKLGGFLICKFDCVILTTVGFCAISPWSFSGFLSNHKKALLLCLLHLHAKFQFIPQSGLPCGCDNKSILFYANN